MKVTWPSVIDAPLDDFMWVGSDFLTPFVLYSMDYDIYDIWNLVPDVWVQSRLLQILEVANLHGYYDMICLGCGPQLHHEDLEQLDEFDLEEMDLKWQVAMISMRLKKFYKKTGKRLQFDAKEPVGFDKTKVECFNCHNTGHFARECRSKGNQESRRRDAGNTGYKAKDNGRRPGKQEEPKALVTLDGEGVDWTGHAEDEQENFALMAYSNSGSDTEVTSCSKECVESYAKLKKLYDEQREQLGDASIEIQAYTQALKKVEAQLVTHQKNQLWYEEKIRFMKIDLDDKTDVLTYHKKLLAEAVKEKEELKTKLENFQSSSKGLSKLLNSQMSKRDKSGLGYGDQVHDGVLSYENEVFQSVFDSRSSDVEDSPVHDRFANVEGMHAVPPPMTGNYMPSGPDREVDDSMFTYGPKQSKTSESDTQTSNFDSCESNSSVETLESVPEPVVVEPKVVSQPKVWSDAPIIEEYESDSDDEYVIQPSKEQERPSSAFVKHVKTPRETVKEQNTYSPSPKADKRDWNGLMSKRLGLGYGFTKKACFVCGSFSHLIKDCDFHEKKMAKQVKLNKKKGKGTGKGENRPVWNNVKRLNHKNKFVPTAVLTRTDRIPVNTASHNFNSQAVSTSVARKVNAVRPIMNENRPRNNFHKSHSPIRRPFNRTTTPRTIFSNQKVNTAKVKAVSAVGGKRETAVKPSAGCNWRPKRHYWNKFSKYNGGSNSRKCDYPQRALKNKGIVDSGCSRHMTGNKAYLAKYQDYNGGPVAFGGSKGYITGKGKIKTGKLDFEDVCFVKELQHFNLFSVSQMCDKKNKVLFTDTECLVLSSDFKLPDENQVLLKIPRQNNMYSFNIENIVPSGGLACLIAKATIDESNKWHRRLGYVNFKNLNKLVKGNLVRVKISEAKNEGEKPNKDTGLKTNEDPVDQEDQAFLEELEGLKRQEKEANGAAEALRKEFAQDAKDLLLQAGATRATSTNTVNTLHTPISTTSPSNVFSAGGSALNNNDQDDSRIPVLRLFITILVMGFLPCFLDDEGAVTDFTNLETTMNVDAMQEELLQFKIQKVWILIDLPYGKKAIGTKWVYRNKKDKRGVVVRNKARIFLAFASYMGFIVYQMDVKSAFLYGTIDEEVYVSQPPGFVDPKFPKKVYYKVVKALYGLHQAPKAWFQMSSMGELTFFLGLQVKQKEDGIFISQDKYVAEILKKFDFMSVKNAFTPIETHKPHGFGLRKQLVVDVIFYRFQVTPKTSHLHAIKKIFRYLKGKPKLGLWYPKETSFDMVAYSDNDYGGANLDRKSTTGEAEYVADANCYGQVLWIQNQMLDYGFNFMNTRIYIDNGSTICIVKNLVFHSKTKHIEIRHHFIRDAYEKKLI
ncbi:putative ribonuclease H-like domain-containing protein [Tanacetum coccineum]